jgi:hypothetical protein
MGYKLAEEAERYAPGSLTYRERYVLSVLAHATRDEDDTRTCPPGFASDPDIRQRLKVNRRGLYETLAALIEKDALIHVKRGHKGTGAVYAIPRFAQDAVNADANGSVSVRETRREGADSPAIGCGSDGRRVRESPTPIQSSRYQDPDLIAIVKDEIKILTGEDITDDHAAGIIRELITASRRPVKNRTAYIRKSIREEPYPRNRFLPHATQAQPERFKRTEDKGPDPAIIAEILATLPPGLRRPKSAEFSGPAANGNGTAAGRDTQPPAAQNTDEDAAG